MIASLVRLRLYAFVRSGRIAGPVVLGIVAVGILYGGGAVPAGEGYGLSAYVLLPILAWTTKLLLDTEPDVARRLAVVTVGRRREIVAGLVAATIVAVALIVLAIVLPWAFGGISGPRPHSPDPPLATGIVLGTWAHLVAVPPALALGALASRVVTRTFGYGAFALVGGWLLIVVVGLRQSPVPWLAPPMMAVSRAAHGLVNGPAEVGLTAWTLGWAAIATAGYVVLRRGRA